MLHTPHLRRSGREFIILALTLVAVGLGLPSFAPSSAHLAPKSTVTQDPAVHSAVTRDSSGFGLSPDKLRLGHPRPRAHPGPAADKPVGYRIQRYKPVLGC